MDGSVIPSFLKYDSTASYSRKDQINRYELVIGEVKNVVYPDADNSRTKLFMEYDVWAHVRSNSISEGQLFYNCVQINPLAGLADQTYHILRANPKAGETGKGFGDGSKVLLLCLNGETFYPIIIGGVQDSKDESQKDLSKDELLFKWIYNGIDVQINNDGEATVTYLGKTKNDGSTDVEDSVAGMYAKFDKDGNFTLSDSDGKNSLVINHKDGNIEIQRDKKLKIGKADEAFVLGTTFRKEQKKMHKAIQQDLASLEQLLQNMGQSLATAGGKQVTPVYGAVAAAADLAMAGGYAISASKIVKKLKEDINAFESAGQQSDYLSDKNFGDE